MKHKTPFSVILPVYHKDNPVFFEEALNSLLKQTLRADEIIVIEDGPLSEGLNQVLEVFEKRMPELKRVKLPENVGLSKALNIGLESASHSWVARMDSDDICFPNRFERQMTYIEEHPDLEIAGSWIQEFEDDVNRPGGLRKVPEKAEEILSYARWRCPFNHMTVFYRREVVLSVGGYDSGEDNKHGFGDDYILWAKMLVKGCKAANIPEVLVMVRTDANFFEYRRRGWNYYRNEMVEVNRLRKIGVINPGQYLIHAGSKFIIRMLPATLLKKVYQLLRN
jgi:glycosyltransferase involved in cell wall biosynthesis